MFLRINEEQKLDIITEDLKKSIDSHKDDIVEMDLKKEAKGMYSWDYEEDRKETMELLDALLKVYDYYGGNI